MSTQKPNTFDFKAFMFDAKAEKLKELSRELESTFSTKFKNSVVRFYIKVDTPLKSKQEFRIIMGTVTRVKLNLDSYQVCFQINGKNEYYPHPPFGIELI